VLIGWALFQSAPWEPGPRFCAALWFGLRLRTGLIGREASDDDRVFNDNPCLGCKLCVAACPVGALGPDGSFHFSCCFAHNYREFLGAFSDWVEQIADGRDALDYRRRINDPETSSMWQSLRSQPGLVSLANGEQRGILIRRRCLWFSAGFPACGQFRRAPWRLKGAGVMPAPRFLPAVRVPVSPALRPQGERRRSVATMAWCSDMKKANVADQESFLFC
jgi:ferredoxin